jgi:hypothetical protein
MWGGPKTGIIKYGKYLASCELGIGRSIDYEWDLKAVLWGPSLEPVNVSSLKPYGLQPSLL